MRCSSLVLRGLLRPIHANPRPPAYHSIRTNIRLASTDASKSFTPFDTSDLSTYPLYSKAAEDFLSTQLNRYGERKRQPLCFDDCFLFAWKFESDAFVKNSPRLEPQLWNSRPKPAMLANFPFIRNAAGSHHHDERADEYLTKMLGNKKDPSKMLLIERESQMQQLTGFVKEYVSLDRTEKKRGLLVLLSSQGSGKTQLLKCGLFSCAARPVANGSVLACNCESESLHCAAIERLTQSKRTAEDLDTFLISIINVHVKTHVKAAFSLKKATVEDAFAAWRAVCGGEHRPLLVFDNTHMLPETTSVAGANGSTQNILEALATRMPSKHGMVAFGIPNIEVKDTRISNVNFLRMGTLGPMSYQGGLATLVMNRFILF